MKLFEVKDENIDVVLRTRVIHKTACLTKAETARRRHQEADDRWRVADVAERALERKASESEAVLNAAQNDVLAYIHPTAGKIDPRALTEAKAETTTTWEARGQAEVALHAAENELYRAEKLLEDLRIARAYHENQAEQRQFETSTERAARERREAQATR